MVLALAATLGAADGCEDLAGLNGSGNCDLDTGESSLLGTLTATYLASGTGDASMSSLSYATDEGSKTINDPKLPFTVTVKLTTARARLRARGTSGTGTLSISVGVSDLIGPREQLQRFCP
jgi:hypothetical protein